MVAKVVDGDDRGLYGAYHDDIRLRKAYAESHPTFKVMYQTIITLPPVYAASVRTRPKAQLALEQGVDS